jgi:hypothetical protein
MMKKLDQQADKVYKWESEWSNWNHKAYDDLKAPRRWMRWAAKQAGVAYRKMRPTHRQFSFYRPHDDTIFLTKQHWNAATVLHEMAHAIITDRYGERRTRLTKRFVQAHGPEWLGVYMTLLARAGIAPMVALRASADAAKLSYSLRSAAWALKKKKAQRRSRR